MHAGQIVLAPIVSEKSYHGSVNGIYTFRVHSDAHKTQIRQAVEELFEVNVAARQRHQGAAEAQAPRPDPRHASRAGRRPSCSSSPVRRSRSSRGRSSDAGPPLQADEPRPPLHDGLRLRRGLEVEAREGADREADQEGRPQQQRPHHDAPPGRRPQAPLPPRSTSSALHDGVPAKVAAIEYDPNRSARIALLHYADGLKAYILAPAGLRVGSEVSSGAGADIKPGNTLPLENIPTGTLVHNVELKPGRGGQIARSAGSGVQLVAKDAGYATLRLPSGEMRRVLLTCRATVGQVGNLDHGNITGGKAGRSRWLGKRPTVRGSAMNPVDHPHGGGEGKSKGGRHPVTPWGVPTLGKRTRRKHKESDKLIVRGRRRGKEKR